jgi:hypothetical protein
VPGLRRQVHGEAGVGIIVKWAAADKVRSGVSKLGHIARRDLLQEMVGLDFVETRACGGFQFALKPQRRPQTG